MMAERILAGISRLRGAADNQFLTGTATVARRDRTDAADGILDELTGRVAVVRKTIYDGPALGNTRTQAASVGSFAHGEASTQQISLRFPAATPLAVGDIVTFTANPADPLLVADPMIVTRVAASGLLVQRTATAQARSMMDAGEWAEAIG